MGRMLWRVEVWESGNKKVTAAFIKTFQHTMSSGLTRAKIPVSVM